MRARSIFLQIIIGIFIIFVIFIKFDINGTVSVLKKTDYIYFIMACISYLFLNLVLAGRLNYLLTKIGYKLRYPTVFLSHMGGMIVGDLTPGRSGYFLTPPILKKNTGTKITDGMACIFAPQGIEFILKVGGAIAAIFYISSRSPIGSDVLISVSIGAILLLIVGILMLIISWRDEELTSKLVRKLPFFKNFTEKVSFFKERSTQIKSSLNAILILYMVGWVFAGLQWFYLGKALGIQLPFFAFFLLHPLITILMFVPISLAGFGIMEGGVVVVFSLLGIAQAPALAFSILVRVSILLVDLIGLKTVLSSLRYSDIIS